MYHIWYNEAMEAEHPVLPNTEVLAVERSEHKPEVFGLLCSGVSPSRTAALILQRYGETLSEDDVRAFAQQIPTEYYLKPGELQRRVKFVDVEIDTIGEMAAILRFYKEEVEIALATMRLTDGDGTVTADTRKLMNQYWTKLQKFEELRGELGLIPVAQQQTPAPAETQLPSLRQLMLQQNLILPPEAILVNIEVSPKTKFVDAEVKVLDAAEAEGS